MDRVDERRGRLWEEVAGLLWRPGRFLGGYHPRQLPLLHHVNPGTGTDAATEMPAEAPQPFPAPRAQSGFSRAILPGPVREGECPMIEIYSDDRAQGRKEDVGNIRVSVFCKSSSAFDEQLSRCGEQGDAQGKSRLPRRVAGTGVHNSGGEPGDDRAQDHIQGSVVRVHHVVVEGDQRADFEVEMGSAEVEGIEVWTNVETTPPALRASATFIARTSRCGPL